MWSRSESVALHLTSFNTKPKAMAAQVSSSTDNHTALSQPSAIAHRY